MELLPGRPRPLGVTFGELGANVAVYAPHAETVLLCLFDDDGTEHQVELPERHGPAHHGLAPGLRPGQRYGFRVHGAWDPRRGRNANPAKLLADPYARAFDGQVRLADALRLANDDLSPHTVDSAPFVPRSVAFDPSGFDWGDDRRPLHPVDDLVIYEAHVKGLTKLFPGLDESIRGTYAGLADPRVIEHLTSLGITSVELLPVHESIEDPFLQRRGLRNYWGYQTYGFFAPQGEYASSAQRGEQVDEFRRMVKALHAAGLEVYLDVVFNHTGEGDFRGPTLSFRGLAGDYYLGDPDDRTRYLDTTGCGNSLNMMNPFVLQLVMDSLRYWVIEMHVDGFRFDLAATLAREGGSPDRLSSFFDLVQQDPVLGDVKLIAEPWDIGWGGYQVGNFPWQWGEWNGKFRDCVRDFWRGQRGTVGELATRLAGSSDLYAHDLRPPAASVNFVTAHDGFTLRDLVSYNEKHNEANGEDNRDGESHNRSWNCGAEGPTDDPEINRVRARQQRNLLTTLLLAQGTPMLLGGDELGRTQHGNNNGYCQDNELSWFDWEAVDRDLLAFTRHLVTLRREQAVFRRRHFLTGLPANGSTMPDVEWLTPMAAPMTGLDWNDGRLVLGVYLNGDAITLRDFDGEERISDTFYLCINGSWDPQEFRLPSEDHGREWTVVVDTAVAVPPLGGPPVLAGGSVRLLPRATVVLQRPRTES